ncbi:hypothetical protein GCM10009591_37520 [Brachybacterium tyrofermentans]
MWRSGVAAEAEAAEEAAVAVAAGPVLAGTVSRAVMGPVLRESGPDAEPAGNGEGQSECSAPAALKGW